ncbi:hypothetical protein L3Y34_009725 [Caenorhabditis briggsae]|uniref:FAD dependent oxidoreductase domain-containing protein n=1 Tax=Caenorhabditis briggsae TaxID=6238 RepID=A0AAE9A6B7_CAEBR|nr:hypothetical protein L3Y34_009725 [Caenorhabditis briggsae]ULT92180.1 hypothetical protein L3Y34_009725 [Caenorhabditis briggsae]
MVTTFDVVVVGAGIFGSCTAYHCQKLGLQTLLLEQFTLGHSNGSSHGKSRIIRYAHAAPEYVPLVADAYTQIEALEKKRGEKLWNKLGLLWAATGNQVNEISVHLKNLNIEHEVIPGNEISNHYPQLKFDEKWTGLVDPMGGVIYANKWLNAFQKFGNGVLLKKVWLVDLSQFHDLSQLTNCLQTNPRFSLVLQELYALKTEPPIPIGCVLWKLLENLENMFEKDVWLNLQTTCEHTGELITSVVVDIGKFSILAGPPGTRCHSAHIVFPLDNICFINLHNGTDSPDLDGWIVEVLGHHITNPLTPLHACVWVYLNITCHFLDFHGRGTLLSMPIWFFLIYLLMVLVHWFCGKSEFATQKMLIISATSLSL